MKFSLTPQLVVEALAAVVTEAVAFGLINTGVSQTILAAGGIIVPAAFAIASALHLGQVHAAQVNARSFAPGAKKGDHV